MRLPTCVVVINIAVVALEAGEAGCNDVRHDVVARGPAREAQTLVEASADVGSEAERLGFDLDVELAIFHTVVLVQGQQVEDGRLELHDVANRQASTLAQCDRLLVPDGMYVVA